MTLMPNVSFEIFRDAESLGIFTTDEFGQILLTNCEPGTYRAEERDTGGDGHVLDTTPQEVELKAGDGIKELVFFNDRLPGIHLPLQTPRGRLCRNRTGVSGICD